MMPKWRMEVILMSRLDLVRHATQMGVGEREDMWEF